MKLTAILLAVMALAITPLAFGDGHNQARTLILGGAAFHLDEDKDEDFGTFAPAVGLSVEKFEFILLNPDELVLFAGYHHKWLLSDPQKAGIVWDLGLRAGLGVGYDYNDDNLHPVLQPTLTAFSRGFGLEAGLLPTGLIDTAGIESDAVVTLVGRVAF